MLAGLDSHPEHTRRFRSREEAVAAEGDLDRLAMKTGQCLSYFPDCLRRFVAHELQGYVQRLLPDPAYIRAEAPHSCHEGSNPLADSFVNVESDKDSHSRDEKRNSIPKPAPQNPARRAAECAKILSGRRSWRVP